MVNHIGDEKIFYACNFYYQTKCLLVRSNNNSLSLFFPKKGNIASWKNEFIFYGILKIRMFLMKEKNYIKY